jgi:type I restriction enzyme R subunit
MTSQPEQILENNLVAQLVKLGYKKVEIKDETDLLANLKVQLEIHNKITLTDSSFQQILNYINK